MDLQEINVAFGGTDVTFVMVDSWWWYHAAPYASIVATSAHVHDIDVIAGSVLDCYAGEAEATVNSVHFQAIDRMADGLVNATSSDGVVEAISVSHSSAPWYLPSSGIRNGEPRSAPTMLPSGISSGKRSAPSTWPPPVRI